MVSFYCSITPTHDPNPDPLYVSFYYFVCLYNEIPDPFYGLSEPMSALECVCVGMCLYLQAPLCLDNARRCDFVLFLSEAFGVNNDPKTYGLYGCYCLLVGNEG